MKIVPKHVIDIGGNIGQFPLTMAAILPDVSVDALEPNSDIYKILKKNVKPYKNVHVYNVGVGKATQEATMFYQPAHSCTGSLLAENAGDAETLKEIPITLVDDIPKLTKRSQYDLATIDVEGYEMDVLKSLKGLKTRYLFIEVSSQGRAKTYLHSRLFDTIREMFGAFDIVYSLGQSAGAAAFDVLLEFPETPSPTLG